MGLALQSDAMAALLPSVQKADHGVSGFMPGVCGLFQPNCIQG
ncbi:hypothetical protein SynMITS9220_00674 [Synechococcus sp. MIT S9220]|nr:hypothetical protein SynMITS9220_00674 [Synechococcus sp. MIT S9220]